MEKIVPLFNKLQEIIHQAKLNNVIQLPQLVVVGAQSTGKSSVLESIVGKDFLQRGSGIVTRRPTILQLMNISEGEQEHAEFAHLKHQRFTDWNEVRRQIEVETDKIAGTNKGISKDPIILKVYSPDVVNLTLVDLPGMTKIPVGEQPNDIEQRIREIILTYAQNPNTVILAVTAANTDLANSDSLKLAREVDPDGYRTVGIVTKLDLMDEGTDYFEALQGNLYPLKLGYIGIVCRKQKELESGKSIGEAVKSEKQFFNDHEVYKKMADKMGVPYLIKVLNIVFLNHIKNTIPTLKASISNLLQEKQCELAKYGELGYDIEDNKAKGRLILDMISRFCKNYDEILSGQQIRTQSQELFGGARISYILKENFIKSVEEVQPFDVLTDDDIRTEIANSQGLSTNLFIPTTTLEVLLKQQISRLQEPCIECSHITYEELRKVLFHVKIPELERFKVLSDRILKLMQKLLKKHLEPTDGMIQTLIEIELGFLNFDHPDFIGGIPALKKALEKQQKKVEKQEEEKKNGDASSSKSSVKSDKKNSDKDSSKKEQQQQSSGGGFFSSILGGGSSKAKTTNQSQKIADDIDSKIDNFQVASFQSQQKDQNQKSSSSDQSFTIEKNPFNKFGRIFLPQPSAILKVQENPSNKEQLEVNMLKILITNYFDIVKKNICDTVPKTIITLLITKLLSNCERELVAQLYHEENFDDLLAENEDVARERKRCKQELDFIKSCANLLNEIDSRLNLNAQ